MGSRPTSENYTPYRSLTHFRDYSELKEKTKFFGSDEPAISTLMTQPSETYGLGFAGARFAHSRMKNIPIGKYFAFDEIYKLVRKGENRLPVFRIPLRASQIGDLISPFTSSRAYDWRYKGTELLDDKLNWRSSFSSIGETLEKDLGKTQVDTLRGNIRKHGLEFQKTGQVFGDVKLIGRHGPGAIQLKDVFMMERPSTKSGALTALWEASRRQTAFFQALPDDHWSVNVAREFGGEKWAKRAKFGGGFFKNYVGDYFGEFVRGMNRFLQEPVPYLDKILSMPAEERSAKAKPSDDILIGNLEKFFGETGGKQERIAFSRLKPWMRPYVSDPEWTKSSLRMLTAISAKGAFYTKGIPTAYMLTDYLRRQFDWSGSSVISTPLFAGIGLGVGSLITSGRVQRSPVNITKTQLGGAIIGGLVGALPAFDKGLTSGMGEMYGRFRIASSKFWNVIGAQEAAERQEALFPGITSPITGAGFMMFGGMLNYLGRETGSTKSMLKMDSRFVQEMSQEVPQMLAEWKTAQTSGDVVLKEAAQQRFRGVFERYSSRDTLGFRGATKEAEEILLGTFKGAAPRSEAGLVAMMLKSSPDMHDMLKRPESAIQEISGRVFQYSEQMAQDIYTDKIEDSIQHLSSKKQSIERIRGIMKGPKPTFTRGAIRGGAVFGGLSIVGALAAGPMGGNFSPGDFVPGWLVKLTGGGMTPRETEDVMTGKQEVAVRKARWWIFGRSPFEGQRIDYFRPHRAALMQSEAETNALYGSYKEKMDYEPILHPIRYLFDPEFKYHREKRLSYLSPTPLTGRVFTDIPIFGDLLSSTVGEFIKPSMAIRPNEWMLGKTNYSGIVGTPGVQAPATHGIWSPMRNAPAIKALGGQVGYNAQLPYSFAYTGKWTMERMSEQAGLRGFMFTSVLEKFGYQTRTYKPVVESADTTFSLRSKFWGLNLGDPGWTEGVRRYLTLDRNSYYNPLRNLAPSWLPGPTSSYYKDFWHGNYYRSVKDGHLRLPGPGLETLHPELKQFHPENYPLAWKYKILSGVAYGSQEWRHTRERVIQSMQAGQLSQHEQNIVAETNRQIGERSLRRQFRNYQFDKDKLKKRRLTVSAVYEDGTFSVVELGKRRLELGGINYSVAALTRQVLKENNDLTVAAAERLALEKRHEIVKTIHSYLKPGEAIEGFMPASETELYSRSVSEVYMPTLSKKVKGLGGEIDRDSQMGPQVKYNATQKFLGRAWELFTHNIDAPITPAAAINQILPFHPQAKFIQRLTPTELYARTQVYSRDIQMWQRYKEDFLDSAINETIAKISGDFVPGKVSYRRALMEYFDKLTWMKNFAYEQAARRTGNAALVKFYSEKKRQTLYGADPYKGYSDVWRALPRSERDFYRDFIKETDPEERKKIMALVPDNIKHIYAAQWQNKDMQALSNKVASGIASAQEQKDLYAMYNMRRVEGMNWSYALQQQYNAETRGKQVEYADWMRMKRLSRYFQEFRTPGANWVAFDPRVDLEDVKLKVARSEGMDIHDLGLWESQEVSIEKKPYISEAADDLADWSDGNKMSPGEFEIYLKKLIGQAGAMIHTTPLPPGINSKITMLGKDTQADFVKQLMSGYGAI